MLVTTTQYVECDGKVVDVLINQQGQLIDPATGSLLSKERGILVKTDKRFNSEELEIVSHALHYKRVNTFSPYRVVGFSDRATQHKYETQLVVDDESNLQLRNARTDIYYS